MSLGRRSRTRPLFNGGQQSTAWALRPKVALMHGLCLRTRGDGCDLQAITAKSGAKIDISRDAKDGVVPITVTGNADMLKSGMTPQLSSCAGSVDSNTA